MMYSRYVVNDHHFGTLTAAPDRPPINFYDQGHFAAAQLGNKAIALYALMPQHEEVFSLKTVVVFPLADALDETGPMSGGAAELPAPPRWARVVVADGAVYAACAHWPPARAEARCRTRAGGELADDPNYQGAPKRFWDYAHCGAFWRGNELATLSGGGAGRLPIGGRLPGRSDGR
jgi:hypothetical protein